MHLRAKLYLCAPLTDVRGGGFEDYNWALTRKGKCEG